MEKEIKLFDSELKVMEVLWKEGDKPASYIADVLKKTVGWSKTTTYTVIKKCIDKGAVSRQDPKFICRAEITREQAMEHEVGELIDRMYDGSANKLIASLLGSKRMSKEDIDELKELINKK